MKRIISFLLVIMVVFTISVVANASTKFSIDSWDFVSFDGTEWVIGSYTGSNSYVEVITEYGTLSFSSIYDHAFANNDTVESVFVKDGIVNIGDYVFLNDTKLKTVTLASTVNSIGVGAFSGTSELSVVNLERSSITNVAAYTFLNSGIRVVSLPETCIRIADNAFCQCSYLEKIFIPDSVVEIGDKAFDFSDNVVIYASKESYAVEYAIAKGIDYVITNPDYYEVEILLGDADGDNDVSILDATRIQRWLASYNDGNEEQVLLCGDTDRDGDVSILDATLIQRWLAQFTVPTPIGEVITIQVPVTE